MVFSLLVPSQACITAPYTAPPNAWSSISSSFSSLSYSSSSYLIQFSLRKRQTRSIVCAVPARDLVIDFGKYKGSKMGTLPSGYLRWLVRELSHSSNSVWSEYAEQVLEDPYYKDRLEFEKIERLAVKGDLRKAGLPAGDSSVKGSMLAFGWDLTDRDGWSKVNLSTLGTSLGGRIPRKKITVSLDPVNKLKSKAASTNKKVEKTPPAPSGSESLSLQEELLRRRQLRRERTSLGSTRNESTPQQEHQPSPNFPGRDSLLNQVKNKP